MNYLWSVLLNIKVIDTTDMLWYYFTGHLLKSWDMKKLLQLNFIRILIWISIAKCSPYNDNMDNIPGK